MYVGESSCSSSYSPWTYYVAQTDLELTVPLPQHTELWDFKLVTPHPAKVHFPELFRGLFSTSSHGCEEQSGQHCSYLSCLSEGIDKSQGNYWEMNWEVARPIWHQMYLCFNQTRNAPLRCCGTRLLAFLYHLAVEKKCLHAINKIGSSLEFSSTTHVYNNNLDVLKVGIWKYRGFLKSQNKR